MGMVSGMAKYKVLIKPLNKSVENIRSLASGLSSVKERLDGVRTGLPSGLESSMREITFTAESVNVLNSFTIKMSSTLQSIAGVYQKAEKTAFDPSPDVNKSSIKGNVQQPLRLKTQKAQGVLFVGDLTLPDWLQMAVLRYEQSKK